MGSNSSPVNGQNMHAAGRDVDRCRIVEELGDGPAIDVHVLGLLAIDLDIDEHRLEGGADRRRGAVCQNDEGELRRP